MQIVGCTQGLSQFADMNSVIYNAQNSDMGSDPISSISRRHTQEKICIWERMPYCVFDWR